MGGSCGKPVKVDARPPPTALETKVIACLKKQRAQIEKEPPTNFNRILMHFPKIHKELMTLEALFKELDEDGNGQLDRSELAHMMTRLGSPMNEAEVSELFEISDVDHSGFIDFREVRTRRWETGRVACV